MRAFEVHLNGKRLCVAGIGEDGVLSMVITDVARKERSHLDLRVGGLFSNTGEHVEWGVQRLETGDDVRVKIIESTSIDSPSRRRQPDPKEELASKKRYIRRVARELGWEVRAKRATKAKP